MRAEDHAARFLAAYARFAQAIVAIPDPKAQELHRVALAVATFVQASRASEPPLGDEDIANGLAQGLLEMPLLFDGVDGHWRWAVSRALHSSLSAECPGLLRVEAQRLQEVLARGSIADEAEFLLVRHRIDVLEGEPELAMDLKLLHAMAVAWGTGGHAG